ncbi:unannotated protein [freshwater metagenome]|uniref:Unannotated protein n=1 Tax=freshwater metagenome TaxID=449393 RepID=A0A6J6N4W6_9ZZZZ|nr:hypothetical protein [Actinomycetota bacterium]
MVKSRPRFPTPAGPNDYGSAIGWTGLSAWLLEGVPADYLAQHLSDYFAEETSGKSVYQGQHFEWFASRSQPEIFTENDVLAVSALSYTLPAQAIRELLEPAQSITLGREIPNALLAECWRVVSAEAPLDLRVCPENWLSSSQSPFRRLYERLKLIHNVGDVAASKLMAAKFPELIPIWDDRVAGLLYDDTENRWWIPMRNLLTKNNGEVSQFLDSLDSGREDFPICTLRRLDVILWMEASARRVSYKVLRSKRQ